MTKVSIIGAGNVGATAAQFLATNEVCDEVVLLDIKEGVAEGKAIDIMQSMPVFNSMTQVIGVTSNYEATKDSDVIVITSGIPRKPGMTREELVGVNSKVMKSVLDGAYPYSPEATYVIVSNPMDTMTYFTVKYLDGKVPANKIIGMGGILDSNRFTYNIAKTLDIPITDINAFVIGGHGDKTMVPVVSMAKATVQMCTTMDHPITDLLGEEEIDKIVQDTMNGGATLTGLLGTSAWQAPAASIMELVMAIISPERFADEDGGSYCSACSVYIPDYDACIGVVCGIVDGTAVPIPIEAYTNEDEQKKFMESLEAVKKVNSALEF